MATASSHRRLFGACFFVALLGAGAYGCGNADESGGQGGSGNDSGSGNGSGNGSGSGTGTGTPSTGSGGDHYVCCLNDAHFVCPSKAAFDKCIGFDMDACMQQCSPGDFACADSCFDQFMNANHDPSDCNSDDSVDCGGSSSSTSGSGPSTGSGPSANSSTGSGPNCSDILSGCDYDDDCCSNNCTNNTCYGNAFGDPCDYDDDCDSDNCYDGTCQ